MGLTALVSIRVIGASLAQKRVLVPPDAIVTLFAWPLVHTQATLSSPHGPLTLLIRKACIWASAPIQGSRRRHPLHPTERSAIGSPGMPRAFHSQSRTSPCPRPDVHTEHMGFSARSSNAFPPFTGEYARGVWETSSLRQEIQKSGGEGHGKNDHHYKDTYLVFAGQRFLLFAGVVLIGLRVVATSSTEKSLLVPPEAVFTLFARSLFHSR